MPLYLFAQETDPWGSRDFTFKRIGAGTSGSSGGLVQINPEEEPYFLTPPDGETFPNRSSAAPSAAEGGENQAPWFWSGVDAKLGRGGPDRLMRALGQLDLAPQNLAPTRENLIDLATRFGPLIAKHADGTTVSPALALAVMSTESGGRTDVVSSAGAIGLMQLIPETAERFGVVDPKDPDQNISGGVAYLNFLLRSFGQDPIMALAAYNAGEGAVAKNGGVPPYAETRNYVPKVLAAWGVARLLCAVPPTQVSEPCDFIKKTDLAEN